MAKNKLFIFTEGGSKYGLGHISRCIALYDEAMNQGLFPKLIIYGDESVIAFLEDRNFIFANWYEAYGLYLMIENKENTFCLIDSYIANMSTYEGIRELCGQIIFIDDNNRITYPRGIIVNPSINGCEINYKIKEGSKYLLGSKYIILRKAFGKKFLNNIIKKEVEDILLIIGGSDALNLTPKILRILKNNLHKNIKIHVIVGETFKNKKEIKKEINRKEFNLYYNLNALQLRELMIKCDLAITAAGQTTYELIACNLPFICIQVAENQENNIIGLMEKEILFSYYNVDNKLIHLEEYIMKQLLDLNDAEKRSAIIKKMVDLSLGDGASNIIRELKL